MNIYSVIFLFCAFCLNVLNSFAESIDDLYMMTEEYPPYNFLDNGQLKGISVDVLAAVLKEMDAINTVENVQLLPWARGYREVQERAGTMLFSTTHTEARDSLFQWSPAIVQTKISVIALKGKGFDISSADDLKGLRIGVVRDDVGDLLLKGIGIDDSLIQRSADAKNILKKLEQNRVDVVSYDENVAFWLLKSMGKDVSRYEVLHVLKEGDLTFAFHKGTDPELIESFNAALEKVKKSPKYQEILKAYK